MWFHKNCPEYVTLDALIFPHATGIPKGKDTWVPEDEREKGNPAARSISGAPIRLRNSEELGDAAASPAIPTSDKRDDHGGSAASKLRCFPCRTVFLCRS